MLLNYNLNALEDSESIVSSFVNIYISDDDTATYVTSSNTKLLRKGERLGKAELGLGFV